MKAGDGSGNRLEKTTSKLRHAPVLRFLLNLCHRPAIRFGLLRDPRGRFREPRFVSLCMDVLESKTAFTRQTRDRRAQQRRLLLNLIDHHCS